MKNQPKDAVWVNLALSRAYDVNNTSCYININIFIKKKMHPTLSVILRNVKLLFEQPSKEI